MILFSSFDRKLSKPRGSQASPVQLMGKQIWRKRLAGNSEFWLEYKTTVAARRIALESGAFYVPQILGSDPIENIIDFEYLPSLAPLDHCWRKADIKPKLDQAQRIGVILRLIHSRLTVDVRIPISVDILGAGASCFLHGDFNLRNIQYDLPHDRLVVLDWAFTPLVQPPGNWGNVFWDISWMLNSIFCSPPYFRNDYTERKQRAERFLEGYLERSSRASFDPKALAVYCQKVYSIFLRKSRQRHGFLTYCIEWPNRYGLKRFADQLAEKNESIG